MRHLPATLRFSRIDFFFFTFHLLRKASNSSFPQSAGFRKLSLSKGNSCAATRHPPVLSPCTWAPAARAVGHSGRKSHREILRAGSAGVASSKAQAQRRSHIPCGHDPSALPQQRLSAHGLPDQNSSPAPRGRAAELIFFISLSPCWEHKGREAKHALKAAPADCPAP